MASPTWHSGITQDTWGVLPNSDLNASGLLEDANAHWTVDAWSGGIIATGGLYIGSTFTTGTFFVIWGGGHTNSGNNAIYAYGPFEDNSPTWHRLRNTTSTPPQNVSVDGSGNPVSRHTYSFLVPVMDGTRNWLVSIGRTGQYNNAYGDGDINVFNFAQVSPNSNQPWSIKTAGTNSHGDPAVGDCAVYEPSSGKIWFHCIDQHITGSWHVASETFAFSGIYQNDLAGYGGNAQAAIDTTRGIIAMWDNRNGISFYRTSDISTQDYYVPTTTGTAPTTDNGSIVYDAANDCFRVWIGGGKQIWKLKAPATSPYQGGNAWTWSSATPAGGSTPDAQNTNGTFGRFNMINATDIVGMPLMNAYNGTMYFYKSGPSTASSSSAALSGTGSLSGNLKGAGALASAFSGTGSLASTLRGSGALAAALAGTGTLSSTLIGAGALLAALSGVGAFSGTLLGSGRLIAALTGQGALSGTMVGSGALLAALAATGSLSGTLLGSGSMASALAGSATLTALLTGSGALAAALIGTGTLSLSNSGTSLIVATILATGALSGSLTGSGALASSFAGAGAFSGTLVGAGGLIAALIGAGSLNGTPSGSGALQASMSGIGTLNPTLMGFGALACALAGTSSLTGNPSGSGALSTGILSTGSLSALISASAAIAAAMSGTSSMSLNTGNPSDPTPFEVIFASALAYRLVTTSKSPLVIEDTE